MRVTTEEKVKSFCDNMGFNISVLATKMEMPYHMAYDIFKNRSSTRQIKANELLKFCDVYSLNPMDFYADD